MEARSAVARADRDAAFRRADRQAGDLRGRPAGAAGRSGDRAGPVQPRFPGRHRRQAGAEPVAVQRHRRQPGDGCAGRLPPDGEAGAAPADAGQPLPDLRRPHGGAGADRRAGLPPHRARHGRGRQPGHQPPAGLAAGRRIGLRLRPPADGQGPPVLLLPPERARPPAGVRQPRRLSRPGDGRPAAALRVHRHAGERPRQFDVISDYRYRQNLNIGAVRAVFTRQYEAWQVEGVPPILQFDAAPVDLPPVGGADSERVFHQHKVYQYGSDKLEAERFARMTGQASRSAASQLSGESFCALFRAGYRFAMSEDQMAGSSPMPVRPTLNGKEFVLTKVEHEASLDGGYKNKFEASETDGLLSAFSLADTQQGSVLATVVDYPDHHTPRSWRFYEKSDFAPQTQDYLDHDSGQSQVTAQGVYVRLATDPDGTRRWVKLAAHMQTAPEIGAQVIVSRANDESELPELQQIVQAGGTRAVTPLESNSPLSWTASTHVGNSYGARYSDGVNVSFGAKSDANLNRAVLIATNAYNTAKFRDTGYSQGANYGFSTAESAAAGASQDLAATYGPYGPADDILGVNESFGSSFSRSIGKVQSSVANHRISYSDSRFGKSESVLYVEQTTTSTSTHVGTVSNTTTMKADNLSTQTVEGVTTSTSTHTGTVTNTTTMKADNISTQTIGGATTSTSTHTGAVTNTTTMDSTSTTTTTHNGTVNNTTTVNATSNNTTTHNGSVNNFTTITGTSVSKNVIAVQSNSSAIGVNNSNDAVGLAANFSATGLSSAMSATGVSSHISLTGVDFKMNLFGVSEDISLGIVGYRFANKAANPEINMEGPVIQLLAALKIVI
ncbi:hypothetical protein H9L41_15910 [Chitinimonas koreensis]|nr:hypothetical protein H9L41_15910 [Chitinimonas koreensis]